MRDLKEFDRINHQPFTHLTDSYWALWCIRLTLGSNKTGNPWAPCKSFCTGITRLGVKDSRRSLLTLPPVRWMTLDMVLNHSVLQFLLYGETHTMSFFTVAQHWLADIHKAIGACKYHYRSTVGPQVVNPIFIMFITWHNMKRNDKSRTIGRTCW